MRNKRFTFVPMILLLAIFAASLLSCSEKTETPTPTPDSKLSEKQVIEMTQEYLISQPGELQCGLPESVTKQIICGRFGETILTSMTECAEENEGCWLDGSVSVQFCGLSPYSLSVPIAALKKLAQYNGDGLWLVNIFGQWQVNEITGEVIPQNDEAEELLADLNLKSYTNEIYRYCIRYPASWSVYESGETVQIYLSLQEYISIGILPRGTLPASDFKLIVDGMTAGLRNKVRDFQLISKSQLSRIGDDAWEIVYTGKTESGLAFIIKFRIILYKDRLYGITALSTAYEFTTELESAISSFTLFR